MRRYHASGSSAGAIARTCSISRHVRSGVARMSIVVATVRMFIGEGMPRSIPLANNGRSANATAAVRRARIVAARMPPTDAIGSRNDPAMTMQIRPSIPVSPTMPVAIAIGIHGMSRRYAQPGRGCGLTVRIPIASGASKRKPTVISWSQVGQYVPVNRIRIATP
jgi:hypothetical protein